MQLSQAGHKIKNIGFRRVATCMIFFCGLDNQFDDGGKAAAATATLGHSVVHFGGNDQLPTVLIEHLVDDVTNVVIGDVIAAANEHGSLPV
ncbi:hypothetical protein HRS00_13380 [Agrobacterium vaccinii]|nr:hypothetical protein HRS00_13380 [Agrobacterium vaccinii]